MSLRSISIPRRHGLTLVELLMVISIMTILMVVAIPMIRPAFQDRNIREASRQVSSFFAGAQARAAETGRPVGVWMERRDDSAIGRIHAVQLFMAEVPPKFTGAIRDARVLVDATGNIGFSGLDPSILASLIGDGDAFSVRFDHKGPTYVGKRAGLVFSIGGQPPGTDRQPGLPFEVTLPPTRSAVAPLTLPADSVVDLYWSGTGTAGNEFAFAVGTRPVIIVFSPAGPVDYVFRYDTPPRPPVFTSFRPDAPIRLLIGRRRKLIDPTLPNPILAAIIAAPETSNLADPISLWVTINHQTGAIVTTDNADTSHLLVTEPVPNRIAAAREFARRSVQKGGR